MKINCSDVMCSSNIRLIFKIKTHSQKVFDLILKKNTPAVYKSMMAAYIVFLNSIQCSFLPVSRGLIGLFGFHFKQTGIRLIDQFFIYPLAQHPLVEALDDMLFLGQDQLPSGTLHFLPFKFLMVDAE